MRAPRRARYTKIEKLVEGLLEQHGVTQVPVPVESIVSSYGIHLRKGDLEDVSGLIVRDGSSVTIGVNAKQSRTRQRFTIAHEFGHFLLHDGMSSHVDHDYRVNFRSETSSLAVDVEEIEANFFAASFLMPKQFLDQADAIEALDSDTAVGQLARSFNVSRHAMSLRLSNVYREHSPF
ncbi:ImmA/IrrE family metallo-endopeptidase [Tropicibacter alexandrii]|jgi:Zn-dependent peptidase ImmA (M78 family)|uniref:ImmA/IrrE family metallo-endopeptidase n=1 Tax=Tropicibacter alexandrii TaxID=2267683 RepID=UPI000EF5385C|nr:ImmA/IrrE family metallo-endopeptidase [Tropicibacter alexandrii]